MAAQQEDGIMNVKFLATTVVTGLLLNATMGPAPVAAQTAAQQAALESDSTFLLTAGSLALMQVKLGKLAEKKGSSDVVRDFGKRMVDEYSKAGEDIKTRAKGAAYPAPVLLRQHQQLVDQYTRLGKSDFDKSYMAEMVSQHNQAVQLYEREAKDGRVQSLKQLATSLLPTVQGHLTLATETAGTVGADVTATAEHGHQGGTQ
jgi:putative membrane protein